MTFRFRFLFVVQKFEEDCGLPVGREHIFHESHQKIVVYDNKGITEDDVIF